MKERKKKVKKEFRCEMKGDGETSKSLTFRSARDLEAHMAYSNRSLIRVLSSEGSRHDDYSSLHLLPYIYIYKLVYDFMTNPFMTV